MASVKLEEITLIELDEAFAAQSTAVIKTVQSTTGLESSWG